MRATSQGPWRCLACRCELGHFRVGRLTVDLVAVARVELDRRGGGTVRCRCGAARSWEPRR